MIIKLKSRRDIYSAKQLLRYVLTDKGRIAEPFSKPMLLQNVSTLHFETMHRDFLANHKYLSKRKGGLALYHEIISLHPESKKHVTDAILMDLMQTYVQLRKGASRAIVVAKAHTHTDHPHIHFMISANEFRSAKRLRMSRKEMKQLLINFELAYLKKYPQLERSAVHTIDRAPMVQRDIANEDGKRRADKEQHMKQRLKPGTLTKKQQVYQWVSALLSPNTSEEELIKRLRASQDLEVYSYRNKVVGCIALGKKWRFKTLGISPEKQRPLSRYQERLKELSLIREMARDRSSRGRSRG